MSSQSAKSFFEISDMICSLRTLYQHVVHIHLHVASDLIFEDLIDESLVSGSGVLQSEGHYSVAIEALGGHEGGVLLIFRHHPDLIVSGKSIHEAKQSMAERRIYQLVDFWKWKAVLQAGAV